MEKEIKNPSFSEIKNRRDLFLYLGQLKLKLSFKERAFFYVLQKLLGKQDTFDIDQEVNKIEKYFNSRIFSLSKILGSLGLLGWLIFYKKYGKK